MPSMTMAEDESIYNLIPRPQEIPRRPPMHTSKYPGKVDTRNFEFGDNKAKGHATFGLPNGMNAASPQQFTIKHSKEPVLPAPAPPTQPKQKLRAPVPAKDDRPVMGLTSNKNFITANAVDVILKQPPRQPEEFVWTSKACYGKVPMYLRRNKARVTAEKEQFEQYLKMREAPDAQTSVTQLAQDDRHQLIRHLKKKWGVLNEAYQKLSLSVDSAVKKAKKEELERQLAEVEKDIKTLERGDIVLVVDE